MEKSEKMINESDLIDFFNGEYNEEYSADEVKKNVRDELKEFAKSNEVSVKAIMSAYSLFKKYKSGKNTESDITDSAVLSGIVDDYFANNNL